MGDVSGCVCMPRLSMFSCTCAVHSSSNLRADTDTTTFASAGSICNSTDAQAELPTSEQQLWEQTTVARVQGDKVTPGPLFQHRPRQHPFWQLVPTYW